MAARNEYELRSSFAVLESCGIKAFVQTREQTLAPPGVPFFAYDIYVSAEDLVDARRVVSRDLSGWR